MSVVAEGEVPFAVLDDGRVVMARFRTTYKPQPPHSLSDPEVTRWTLTLDGREFTPAGAEEWLPIGDIWARGEMAPIVATSEGDRHVVRYRFFYAHHLGWLSGPVTLTLDLPAMTVVVHKELTFEAD